MSRKRWIIYIIIAIAIIGIGYLFYHYIYEDVAMVVKFNQGVTEDAALQTLSKYDSGIETRSPRDYDLNFFNLFNNFGLNTIEFETCRWCGYAIESHIAAEPDVQKVIIIEHPPTPQEDQAFYDKFFAPQTATTTTSTQ